MNTLHQQMIFPDENAPPIHRKKSVVTAAAASGRSIGTVLAQKKKPGGGERTRRALNDITNKSSGVLHPKASSNNKQIASGSGKCETNNIGGEMFLHDHTKCIKEQQGLWDDHFSADLLLHYDSSSVKDKHLKYETAMMNASKNNLTCDEPEEIQSPKLTSYMKRSTPWRSPVRHGSVMKMPSTPLAWRFEFTLKEEDYDDLLF